MPNDKSLVRAMNGYPAQTYNPNSQSYEESHGSNNAPHMKVTDPNTGEPIDPREVDMTEVINRLDAIETRLNGVLDTQVTGSNVEKLQTGFDETISGSIAIELSAGMVQDLVLVDSPCILESFSIGTNGRRFQVRVENQRRNGTYQTGMRIVHPQGLYQAPIQPLTLHDITGENDFWREFVYDEENDIYSLGMKRTAFFGSGLRIRIENPESETKRVAATYLITKYKS